VTFARSGWKALRFIEFWDIRSNTNAIRETNKKPMFGRKVHIELSQSGDHQQNGPLCAENRQATVARVQKFKRAIVTIQGVGILLAHLSVVINQNLKYTTQHLILTIVLKQSTISA
jgi:RNA recognition motif-containing protein